MSEVLQFQPSLRQTEINGPIIDQAIADTRRAMLNVYQGPYYSVTRGNQGLKVEETRSTEEINAAAGALHLSRLIALKNDQAPPEEELRDVLYVVHYTDTESSGYHSIFGGHLGLDSGGRLNWLFGNIVLGQQVAAEALLSEIRKNPNLALFWYFDSILERDGKKLLPRPSPTQRLSDGKDNPENPFTSSKIAAVVEEEITPEDAEKLLTDIVEQERKDQEAL